MPPPAPQTPKTIVLLGASNLATGFPLLFENLTRGFGTPLRVLTAYGHGRSFGRWSRFLCRGLPGIIDCGLWDALNGIEDDRAARSLLLTDVGNDLVYGIPIDQILRWVETCIDRVGAESSNTILTLPPVDSLLGISAWRYRVMRTVTFPGCRIPPSTMIESAVELAERLEVLGQYRGAFVVRPPAEWFGFDPIHVRRGRRSDAWRSMLSSWPNFDTADWVDQVPGSRKMRRRDRLPALRTLFGRVQRTVQPVSLESDCTLSVF